MAAVDDDGDVALATLAIAAIVLDVVVRQGLRGTPSADDLNPGLLPVQNRWRSAIRISVSLAVEVLAAGALLEGPARWGCGPKE